MKKTLTIVASIVAVSLNSFAQGTFSMIYYDGATGISVGVPPALINPAGHAGFLLGQEYSAQAFMGPAGTPEGSLTPVAATLTRFDLNGNTRSAGAGGTAAAGSGQFYVGDAVVTALPVGAAVIQIRVWFNNNVNATYDAAVLAGVNVGKSAVLPITLKAATDPTLQDLNSAGLAPFTVQVVPEPSTLALAGLGAVALLALRRRK